MKDTLGDNSEVCIHLYGQIAAEVATEVFLVCLVLGILSHILAMVAKQGN